MTLRMLALTTLLATLAGLASCQGDGGGSGSGGSGNTSSAGAGGTGGSGGSGPLDCSEKACTSDDECASCACDVGAFLCAEGFCGCEGCNAAGDPCTDSVDCCEGTCNAE